MLIIHMIGNEQYGQFVLAQTYMYVVDAILNIQSWQGVIYYGQLAVGARDVNELNGVIKLGSIVDFVTAIIGGIIAINLAPAVGKILGWDQMIIFCAQIFSYTIFSNFSGTPTGVLRLLNKFNLVSLQKFLSAIIKLMGLFAVLISSDNVNLDSMVFVYVVGDILGNVLLVIFALYSYSRRYSVKKFLCSKLPRCKLDFVRYTLWSTLNGIVDLPVSYLDVFIVSTLGDVKVAIYKVFKQLINVFSKVTTPIQQASLPQFTELVMQHQEKYGFLAVKKIRDFILRVFSLGFALLGLSSPIWLAIFYGSEYAAEWWVFCLFLFVQLFALAHVAIHPFFAALGRAKESTLYIAFANVIYLIIAFILIQKVGLFGMVIAFAVQVFLAIGMKYRKIQKQV